MKYAELYAKNRIDLLFEINNGISRPITTKETNPSGPIRERVTYPGFGWKFGNLEILTFRVDHFDICQNCATVIQ